MPNTDYKLTFKIDADSRQATSELRKLDGILGKIGTAGAGTFSAIAGPAAAAGAAISAVAGIAATAGAALFGLAKQASEFGSAIKDASDKTGLHAETLSAMDLAAKQSGSSLERISGAVAKFSKTVGAAADGSKEAAAHLKEFGIAPKEAIDDLDGALGKVFKRIVDAKPGVEQITLAQKAFGKSGADLLPFIKQFDGDLPGLIAKAKELGVTLSDKDAQAADDFGDQMDELRMQIGAAGRAIGYELMPVFTDMAKDMSNWLATNKGEIRSWGETFAGAMQRTVSEMEQVNRWLADHPTFWGVIKQGVYGALSGDYTGTSMLPQGYAPGRELRPEDTALMRYRKKPGDPGNENTGSGSAPGKSVKDVFKLSPAGKALVDSARQLGISPLDLATLISFETAGTFSPSIRGGAGNKYQGLIQFGPSERAAYGVKPGQSFEEQITGPVVKFFQDRFAKAGRSTAGADLLTLYRTVIGGSPEASITAKDAFGTSALSGVMRMLKEHRPAALAKFFGGKEGNIPKDDWGAEYDRYLRQFEDDQQKELDIFKTNQDRKRQIFSETIQYQIDQAQIEQDYLEAAGDQDGALAKAKEIADLKIQLLENEKRALEELYDQQTKRADKEATWQQIELKTIEIQREKIRTDAEQKRSEKALHDQRKKNWSEHIKNLIRIQELEDAEFERQAQERARARQMKMEGGMVTAKGTLGGGIAAGMGVDLVSVFDPEKIGVMKEQGQYIKDIYADISDFAGRAIGQMVDSLAQLAVAWIVTGDFSAKAALSMLASIAMSVATQAAFKAVFEYAEAAKETALALASAAVGDAAGAALHGAAAGAHTAAAKMYITTAAIAGGAGIGLAVGARFAPGSGSGGRGNSGSQSGSSSRDREPERPYSRVTQDAYISRRDPVPAMTVRALERLNDRLDKLENMRPGEVLVAGMRQRPGAVGQQVERDIARDASIGSRLGRKMGFR
ncbi:MAG: hypothetical protein ACK4S4_09355 [Pyrinomonadaceae bacterium]